MEQEIKVGDYIRTYNGMIAKVLKIRQKTSFKTTTGHISTSPERYFIDNQEKYSISKPYVKIYNSDILKVLEVGDIVNGYQVEDIAKDYVECNDGGMDFKKEDIKTIMTKEEYEKKSYKV